MVDNHGLKKTLGLVTCQLLGEDAGMKGPVPTDIDSSQERYECHDLPACPWGQHRTDMIPDCIVDTRP